MYAIELSESSGKYSGPVLRLCHTIKWILFVHLWIRLIAPVVADHLRLHHSWTNATGTSSFITGSYTGLMSVAQSFTCLLGSFGAPGTALAVDLVWARCLSPSCHYYVLEEISHFAEGCGRSSPARLALAIVARVARRGLDVISKIAFRGSISCFYRKIVFVSGGYVWMRAAYWTGNTVRYFCRLHRLCGRQRLGHVDCRSDLADHGFCRVWETRLWKLLYPVRYQMGTFVICKVIEQNF